MTTSGVGAATGVGGDGTVAGTATHDIFAFGFRAQYIQICLEASMQLADTTSTRDAIAVYFRPGQHLTQIEASYIARPGVDVPATSSTFFIHGAEQRLASGAIAMSPAYLLEGSENAVNNAFGQRTCEWLPWNHTGIIMHSPNTGEATVDVTAF